VIQFLFDEDLSPTLRDAANERGYNAYHIQYLEWKGKKDPQILRRMLDENLTLVTGNWRDFRPMLKRVEVHPGAISLPDVPRVQQVRLFNAAVNWIEGEGGSDLVNLVLLLDEEGNVDPRAIP
jgi:predicted nuclease of predicted toxin-antitoxin system